MYRFKQSLSALLVLVVLTTPTFAVIILNDGGPHEIDHDVFEDIEIYDGPSGQPTTVKIIADIEFEDVRVYQNSRFYMTAGNINGRVTQYDFSYAEISGGRVGDDPFWLNDNCRLVITGGQIFEGFHAFRNSQILIYGANFTMNGMPLDYGMIPNPEGLLSGVLLNGGTIDSFLHINDHATVTLIPEPTALALLALAGLFFRQRRS